tara:strand:+ start:305 stop:547 length:243 start_codon:yes stop_codon:yes gene_type:complete
MSKSKLIIDRLAKLIEEGLVNSKDISDEIKNSLKFSKENIVSRLDLVKRSELEILKARLDKIEKKLNKSKKSKIKKVRKS